MAYINEEGTNIEIKSKEGILYLLRSCSLILEQSTPYTGKLVEVMRKKNYGIKQVTLRKKFFAC